LGLAGHTAKQAINNQKINVMKVTTTILALCLICISFVGFAGNGESILAKKLNSRVKYPELASGNKVETSVFVQLSVNELGEIIIDKIECSDAEVTAAIAEQIRSIRLAPDTVFSGKTYRYKFVLKVQ
jgi:hypothetical protein